jgi:hypothetical protein
MFKVALHKTTTTPPFDKKCERRGPSRLHNRFVQTGSNHARSWSKANEESPIHERFMGFDFVVGRPFDRLAVT